MRCLHPVSQSIKLSNSICCIPCLFYDIRSSLSTVTTLSRLQDFTNQVNGLLSEQLANLKLIANSSLSISALTESLATVLGSPSDYHVQFIIRFVFDLLDSAILRSTHLIDKLMDILPAAREHYESFIACSLLLVSCLDKMPQSAEEKPMPSCEQIGKIVNLLRLVPSELQQVFCARDNFLSRIFIFIKCCRQVLSILIQYTFNNTENHEDLLGTVAHGTLTCIEILLQVVKELDSEDAQTDETVAAFCVAVIEVTIFVSLQCILPLRYVIVAGSTTRANDRAYNSSKKHIERTAHNQLYNGDSQLISTLIEKLFTLLSKVDTNARLATEIVRLLNVHNVPQTSVDRIKTDLMADFFNRFGSHIKSCICLKRFKYTNTFLDLHDYFINDMKTLWPWLRECVTLIVLFLAVFTPESPNAIARWTVISNPLCSILVQQTTFDYAQHYFTVPFYHYYMDYKQILCYALTQDYLRPSCNFDASRQKEYLRNLADELTTMLDLQTIDPISILLSRIFYLSHYQQITSILDTSPSYSVYNQCTDCLYQLIDVLMINPHLYDVLLVILGNDNMRKTPRYLTILTSQLILDRVMQQSDTHIAYKILALQTIQSNSLQFLSTYSNTTKEKPDDVEEYFQHVQALMRIILSPEERHIKCHGLSDSLFTEKFCTLVDLFASHWFTIQPQSKPSDATSTGVQSRDSQQFLDSISPDAFHMGQTYQAISVYIGTYLGYVLLENEKIRAIDSIEGSSLSSIIELLSFYFKLSTALWSDPFPDQVASFFADFNKLRTEGLTAIEYIDSHSLWLIVFSMIVGERNFEVTECVGVLLKILKQSRQRMARETANTNYQLTFRDTRHEPSMLHRISKYSLDLDKLSKADLFTCKTIANTLSYLCTLLTIFFRHYEALCTRETVNVQDEGETQHLPTELLIRQSFKQDKHLLQIYNEVWELLIHLWSSLSPGPSLSLLMSPMMIQYITHLAIITLRIESPLECGGDAIRVSVEQCTHPKFGISALYFMIAFRGGIIEAFTKMYFDLCTGCITTAKPLYRDTTVATGAIRTGSSLYLDVTTSMNAMLLQYTIATIKYKLRVSSESEKLYSLAAGHVFATLDEEPKLYNQLRNCVFSLRMLKKATLDHYVLSIGSVSSLILLLFDYLLGCDIQECNLRQHNLLLKTAAVLLTLLFLNDLSSDLFINQEFADAYFSMVKTNALHTFTTHYFRLQSLGQISGATCAWAFFINNIAIAITAVGLAGNKNPPIQSEAEAFRPGYQNELLPELRVSTLGIVSHNLSSLIKEFYAVSSFSKYRAFAIPLLFWPEPEIVSPLRIRRTSRESLCDFIRESGDIQKLMQQLRSDMLAGSKDVMTNLAYSMTLGCLDIDLYNGLYATSGKASSLITYVCDMAVAISMLKKSISTTRWLTGKFGLQYYDVLSTAENSFRLGMLEENALVSQMADNSFELIHISRDFDFAAKALLSQWSQENSSKPSNEKDFELDVVDLAVSCFFRMHQNDSNAPQPDNP